MSAKGLPVRHIKLHLGLSAGIVVLSTACSSLLGLKDGIEAARNCTSVKECGPNQVCHKRYCLQACEVDEDCASHDRCDGRACVPTGDRCLIGEKKCDGLQPLQCNKEEMWVEEGDACEFACKAGACFVPNSCLPDLKCGANQVPCCASDVLPKSTFQLSYSVEPDELATVTRSIKSVALDRYEVSIGRFRLFVDAYETARKPREDAGALPGLSGTGWRQEWSEDPTLMPPSQDSLATGIKACGSLLDADKVDMPARCINWYVALAFCIWDGGRLPAEAEWVFAATNGDEQRYYPWSDPADSAAIEQSNACFRDSDHRWSEPLPVGDRPDGAGKYGHQDLAGNVWELVNDSYGERLPDSDCVGVAGGVPTAEECARPVSELRVMRGGSFVSRAPLLNNLARFSSAPWMRDPTIGFRCVRDFD